MNTALNVPGWNSELSVGDPYLDAQHAMLLRLIDQLKRALAFSEPRDLLKILDEVKKFATFHFASEENCTADVDYPDRHRHARIHTRMLVELADHVRIVETHPSKGHGALRFIED